MKMLLSTISKTWKFRNSFASLKCNFFTIFTSRPHLLGHLWIQIHYEDRLLDTRIGCVAGQFIYKVYVLYDIFQYILEETREFAQNSTVELNSDDRPTSAESPVPVTINPKGKETKSLWASGDLQNRSTEPLSVKFRRIFQA